MSKVCTVCAIEKPASEYYKCNNKLMSRCKACHALVVKNNYVKRDNKIEKLSQEKKQQFLNFLEYNTPLNIMSKKLNISKPTLRKYLKLGSLRNMLSMGGIITRTQEEPEPEPVETSEDISND
jgi:ribosomal protein S8